MKTFSQRKGLKSLSEIIQTNSMSTELRTSLWNALDEALWSTPGYVGNKTRTDRSIDPFSRALWFHHFKKSVDSRPILAYQILDEIRRHFFKCQWFEVYDFLEFVVLYYKRPKPRLAEFLNQFLERELSGYRFVRGHLTDITSTEEREMLESAFADSQFTGVTAHLERALELYANRENPDYRNSIKESISAVESMARIAAHNDKATLGDALKAIETRGSLHPALKQGFMKLYGYTSDEDGIRHAMLEEPSLSAADARYFLLSCTSFVNYLKAKLS